MSAGQDLFQVGVTSFYALAVPAGAVLYFRTVRVPRPPVGTFNGRDIVVMMGFVLALPFLYLALPGVALPVVLALVFAGGLTVGYQPVVGRAPVRWALILALLAADLVGHQVLGAGTPFYWVANSCIVGLIVVSATNLNVQGGMPLKNVAWFVLLLAVYDLTFATVIPLTQELAEAIQGYPFAPSAGLRAGGFGAVIGMGDLLAYSLYTAAAYKAYGRSGLRAALGIVLAFGSVLPTLAPLAVEALTGSAPALVPAQVFFGPAAFAGYLVLRRRLGAERRMAEVPVRAPDQTRSLRLTPVSGSNRSMASGS
ncbi:hypothetical protein [Actinomadura xylanilytica]|uniref:hypothetical protein n=1 Tax=Actinomadura xylanilytica TaxID=887459 RepID=UPI00255ADA4E|nr:hypothetical protein [Actinomadura xylanilytica]MDL4777096.1 hypothetical protein [Actinomadura xylanilytica]